MSIIAESKSLERFSSQPEDVVGYVLDGRYLIEGVLGEGAMAVVLGARHLFLDKRVAVKVLHPALVAVAEMRERFLREARVTSEVDHPGLVRVSDFGVTTEGLHYLVMEQLEGLDLLTWSERRGQASAEECATIAMQVCDALAALHGAGFVHRDLKPENLWIAQIDGRPSTIKVLDLGIVGLIESSGDARIGRNRYEGRVDPRRLTQQGQTLGTTLYMSPEQAIGNPLDQRSDLYSLGCVLWELSTDRCAFEGTSPMDIMMKQVSEVPPAPSTLNPTLPRWFDSLVMKLLEKSPEDRFQSAVQAGCAFAEALGSSAALLTALPPRPLRASRRWMPWAGAAVLVASALVVVLVLDAEAPPVAQASGRGVASFAGAIEVAPPGWLEVKAAATTVNLVFAVEPEGAKVWHDGKLLGTTPFVLTVPRAKTRGMYMLSAEGRQPIVIELPHDAGIMVQEKLARLPVKPPPNMNGVVAGEPPAHAVTPGETSTRPSTTGPAGDGLWQPEKPPEKPPEPDDAPAPDATP